MKASELINILNEYIEIYGDNKVVFINEKAEEYTKFDAEEFKNAIVFVGIK